MSAVHFTANARIKDVVGRELILDDNIAVAELVKNAIDAGAQRVHIVFGGAEGEVYGHERGRVVIVDNGEGMSKTDIVDKWLNIAYSEKRSRKAGGKIYAGNKGIGRFSCDRLGKHLCLRAGRDGAFLAMSIDWEQFEVDEVKREIGGIPLELREGISGAEFRRGLPAPVIRSVSGGAAWKTGIALEMTGLRSEWNRKKILVLRRVLEKMVNPRDSLLVNREFEIHLHADELDDADRKSGRASAAGWQPLSNVIDNDIFKKLSIEATCAKSRVVNGGKRIETEIMDRGRMVAKVTEKNPYPALEDVRISLYYLNRYKKTMFARKTGMTTLEFGSVFLFLNGFRVPPYGDRGDDWLSLDNRKAQEMMRSLGTRNILGWIEVLDPKGKFQVVSSREGLVHNDAYRDLVNVDRSSRGASYGGHLHDVLGRLQAYVVDGLAWDSLPKDMGEKQIGRVLDEGGGEIYKIGPGEKDRRILRALHKIAAPSGKGRAITRVEIDPRLLEQLRGEERERAAKILGYMGDLSSKGALAHDQTRALAKIREGIEKQAERIHTLQQEHGIAEEAAAIERSRSMFLERQVTPGMRGVWTMGHQMIQVAGSLRHNVERVALALGKSAPTPVMKRLHDMRRDADEMSALCRYIVNRSFEDAFSETVGDIPEFLRGFVGERGRNALVGDIHLSCDAGLEFASKFSPMDLTIVLDNLVDNAIKAAGRFQRKPNIRMRAQVKGEEFVLRFADDAGGLDKSIKDPKSIFGLGFTTTSGMGVGLDIVRESVEEKMHGKISCLPLENGLEFEMHFPKR